MSDADVQIAPDGTGKLVDTGTVSTGAGTVHRQRTAIGDPTAGSAIAAVNSTGPVSSSYGLVTRPVNANWVQQVNHNPGAVTLGASSSFQSNIIDLGDLSGGGASYSKWRVFMYVDQPGTLTMEQSPDNFTTAYGTIITPISASTPTTYESLIVMRYLRILYVNGSNANSIMVIRGLLLSI